MTDDFKETLFNYLIGNLPDGKGTDDEIIKEMNEISKFSWDNFLPQTNQFQFNGLIQSNTNDVLVLYGEFVESEGTVENDSRGIIFLLDSEFRPIKTIYQFQSGTYLRPIQSMIQLDDGTFVAVDSTKFCENTNREDNESASKRFIMLNNFTIQNTIANDYLVILNKSYIFPNNYNNFKCVQIYRNPNFAHYVMIGLRYITVSSSVHYDGVAIIELRIEVSSENEWSIVNDDNTNWIFGGSYCSFNEENSNWKIILTHNTTSGPVISLWTKSYNGQVSLEPILDGDGMFVDNIAMNNQSVFLNQNEMYFVVNNERWGPEIQDRFLALYKYNDLSNTLTEIKKINVGSGDYNSFRSGIFLSTLNNELYINYCEQINNLYNANYYFQRLKNDIWNPILVYENRPFWMEYRYFYVSNKFNLVKEVSFPTTLNSYTWFFASLQEIYNSLNYNGQPYVNSNALISNSAEIYSNDSLVFARNLYNKSLNNNTTVATVEIPNNYLNDIDLTNKILRSKTNLSMIEDTNVLQKNIYETLFINFINTIQIVDRNNINQVLNSVASSFLNNSINDESSYNNAKFYSKIIVYYQDSTTKEIGYEYQNKSNTTANIVFALYSDKLLDHAEIISNDKSTIYQTIDLSTLELNKYYKISQKLEVV